MLLRRGFRPTRLDVETRPKLALRLELGILLFNGLSLSDFLDSLHLPPSRRTSLNTTDLHEFLPRAVY